MVMKVLRKKGVMKKILWFIAVIIILSFGVFSQANRLSTKGQLTHAGKVFGRTVSLEDFNYYYQQTNVQAMLQYGQNFNKIREMLNLDSETWDRIILMHEVQKRKIKIPDQAVVDAVKGYKFFQRDSQFDKLLYDDVLRYVLKVRPREFEEGIRNSLKFAELYKQETATVNVSDEETRQAFQKKNEKIQLSYVLSSADDFKNQIAADDAQAQKYYTEHKNDFAMPSMINVEYIRLDVPENATDKDKDAAKTKIEDIVKELSSNKQDLAAAAQKFGVEVKTSGLFSMEQPNLQIGSSYQALQKIFELNIGQVTEPMETPNGYQIVKMKEKKEGYVPEYADAKEKVIDAWKLSEAKKLTKQKAEENLAAIKNVFKDQRRPDFAPTAKGLGLKIEQTPVFSRGEYLPGIGISKDFQDVAFSLSENNRLGDVIAETLNGYAVLYLDSKQPMDEQTYEKQKDELREGLLTEKRNAAFSEYLTKLRLQANLQDKISELKAKKQL